MSEDTSSQAGDLADKPEGGPAPSVAPVGGPGAGAAVPPPAAGPGAGPADPAPADPAPVDPTGPAPPDPTGPAPPAPPDPAPPAPPKRNPLTWELRLFFTALSFYTRLPSPSWVGYSDEQLNGSTRYFPAIGWVVGGALAAIVGLTALLLPEPIAVSFGLALTVLMTGAFHEDGFADVCDGFGGGMTRERVLEIMKDSRVGAYAVIGLVLLFGVKITSMTALVTLEPFYGLLGLVFAHVLSRFTAVTIIFTDDYARSDPSSKVRPVGNSISAGGLACSALWLLPFALLLWQRPWWWLALPVALLVRLALGRWFVRRIGGYTGDCLGAAQQVLEVATILTILATIGALNTLDASGAIASLGGLLL